MDSIENLADSIFAAVKDYVAARELEILKRLGETNGHLIETNANLLSLQARVEETPKPKDGEPGRDGKDASAEEVCALLMPKLLEQIPTPVPGPAGANGKDGTDGKSVAPEEVAALLLPELVKQIPAPIEGPAGKDGRDALDGRDGKQGPPGRDALQIEPLPAIDPTKGYARGTYATHEGGLIRAVRNTDPFEGRDFEVAGWAIVTVGVHSLRSELAEDGRTFKVAAALTGGKEVTHEMKLAVLLDAGVFRLGVGYSKGDVVTRDGAMWIAQKELPEGTPGEGSTDWRLSVKRGQNGKDGKDGIRGEKGDTGRAGADLTHRGLNGERY